MIKDQDMKQEIFFFFFFYADLLYGVELDAGAPVPDADEVIQPAADHTGSSADE